MALKKILKEINQTSQPQVHVMSPQSWISSGAAGKEEILFSHHQNDAMSNSEP